MVLGYSVGTTRHRGMNYIVFSLFKEALVSHLVLKSHLVHSAQEATSVVCLFKIFSSPANGLRGPG